MSLKDQCMVCFDSIEECTLIGLACWQHDICEGCLQDADKLAIADESHYPLSCGDHSCAEISNSEVKQALLKCIPTDSNLIEQFLAKADEYSIPAALRIYCASKECYTAQGLSRFINHEVSGEEAAVICPDCDSITCRLCRELIVANTKHSCKAEDLDAVITAFINSVPEDERWLYQKCYSCHSWVNKSEYCNHMTCRCGAQFCLICARSWPNSGNSCSHGCPLYDQPILDSDGYNQNGYHQETGLDRDGNPPDPDTVLNPYGDEEDDDEPYWDEDGYDPNGYDRDGYDRDGYDYTGFNREGYDREWYDRNGYNRNGYNRNGYNKNGRDAAGYDIDGFDRNGISMQGLHRDYYDEEGYDPFGYDPFGFNRAGLTFEGYDFEGYDVEGYDADGYDRDGFNKEGYNRHGFNRYGVDRHGFNELGYRHHRKRDGEIEPGYTEAPDGNLRRSVSEGPSAKFMECNHQTHFVRGSATCPICRWTSDIFYHACALCGAGLCRACDHAGVERQRNTLRSRYLWPGNDSYGVKEMFERTEAWQWDAKEVQVFEMVEFRAQVTGRRRLNHMNC